MNFTHFAKLFAQISWCFSFQNTFFSPIRKIILWNKTNSNFHFLAHSTKKEKPIQKALKQKERTPFPLFSLLLCALPQTCRLPIPTCDSMIQQFDAQRRTILLMMRSPLRLPILSTQKRPNNAQCLLWKRMKARIYLIHSKGIVYFRQDVLYRRPCPAISRNHKW